MHVLHMRTLCIAALLVSARAQAPGAVQVPEGDPAFDINNVQLMDVDQSRGYYCDGCVATIEFTNDHMCCQCSETCHQTRIDKISE